MCIYTVKRQKLKNNKTLFNGTCLYFRNTKKKKKLYFLKYLLK